MDGKKRRRNSETRHRPVRSEPLQMLKAWIGRTNMRAIAEETSRNRKIAVDTSMLLQAEEEATLGTHQRVPTRHETRVIRPGSWRHPNRVGAGGDGRHPVGGVTSNIV